MDKRIKDYFQYGFAVLVICCFFAIIATLIFRAIPEANEKVLYVLLGVTGTLSTQVIDYFFGSSKGSSEKNDIIANGK